MTSTELATFEDAMRRDGMSALTTWMKSVCTRYATGQLVAVDSLKASDARMLEVMAEHLRKEKPE